MPDRTWKHRLLSDNDDIGERSGERVANDARVPGDALHPLDQRVRAALGDAAERQGRPAGQQPELLAGLPSAAYWRSPLPRWASASSCRISINREKG